MMRWSRPEILNSVRELSRFMSGASQAHLKAMLRLMKYVVCTPERGWFLNPQTKWNGKDDYEFNVSGRSDSNYATDPDTRRSVSGYSARLEGVPITAKSGMQRIVALSVTEAELIATVQCAQDMLYIKRILNGIGLKVKTPMILECDNKGAVDLSNNWSTVGRTRHVDTREYFLRELKEANILKVIWIPGKQMMLTYSQRI